MVKRILAFIMALVVLMSMAACGGVLPTEPGQETTPGSENSEPVMTAEQARAAFIEDYKLRKLFDMLIQLPPIPTNAELERIAAEEQKKLPYKTAEAELVDYCKVQGDTALKQLLADYSTDQYRLNEETRTLTRVYDGKTGREFNGGATAETIGFETGYWRVSDCQYYNMMFYASETENAPRLVYRCSMYHYVLNGQDNLAESRNDTVLTAENSTIVEYPDMYMVISLKNVCPNDILSGVGNTQRMLPEVLVFASYGDMMSSFTEPTHGFVDLYISKDCKGNVVNGYTSQPVVAIPDLTGHYIDLSQPDKVVEFEALGIANYKVEWIDNDGSMTSYSIQSVSIPAGTIVDITDMSRDSCIIVTAAKKAEIPEEEPPETETVENDDTAEDAPEA